ncbi:alpha/beta fold hydrolase [Sporosarcina sp. CAU 1771]
MRYSEKSEFLFLHGAGGTKSKWRYLSGDLKEVVAKYVDLAGRDGEGNEDVSSIEKHAEYLSPQIKNNVILVGHSMGGLVAIELANRNKNITGIVLISSHYRIPVNEKFLEKLKDGIYPDGFFYASYSKEIDKKVLDAEKQELEEIPLQAAFSDFDLSNNYLSGYERFSEIQVPILLLLGNEDRLLPENTKEALEEANKNVTTVLIENCGHFPMVEQPKVVSEKLFEFKAFIDSQSK